MVGIDVGLNHFYTDSDGNKIQNPRFLRKAEKALKRAQKRVSRKTKGSKNRAHAIRQLGRTHLKVSRRRNNFIMVAAFIRLALASFRCETKSESRTSRLENLLLFSNELEVNSSSYELEKFIE
jgi:transposase